MFGGLAGWARAQEGTTWPQFQGGPGHEGSLAEGPEPPYRLRWALPAPAGEALSPAIVVGRWAVAVGSEAVYGIDLASGNVGWEIARAGGALSTPAVATADGGQVLLYLEGPSAGGGSGPATPPVSPSLASPPAASPSPAADAEDVSSVVAVDLKDRTELWRTPLEAPSRSGVTVDGERAYVGDQDGNVYAISLGAGAVEWTARVPGRVDAPVAVADGVVYAVARDVESIRVAIAALDAATGERAWPPIAATATSTAGSALSVAGDTVFVGSADRFVHAIAAEDGSERWASLALSLFSPATSLALADGSVFAADISGGLYRLDVADGGRRWSHQLNEVVVRSAPVVAGDSVLVGLGDGRLVALDLGSGHLVWQSEPSPGLIGVIALSADAVIAVRGGRDAGLVAFEHDPAGSLVDVPSPTEFDPGTTLPRYAAAAALVFALAFVPGLLAARRLGPAFAADETEGDPEDPESDEDGPDEEGA